MTAVPALRLVRSLRLRPPLPRYISASARRLDLPQWPGPAVPQPPVGPSDTIPPSKRTSSPSDSFSDILRRWADNPLVQAAVTTVLGLGVVFVGGVGYLEWYKANVLDRMEEAFAPGYDPALELGVSKKHLDDEDHIKRKEQALVDRIVDGTEVGSYWLMIGSKGTGKGTMIIEWVRTRLGGITCLTCARQCHASHLR